MPDEKEGRGGYVQPPLIDRLRDLDVPIAREAADVIERGLDALWGMDPEMWARAEAEMEPYHAQVQGFVYEDAETGGNLHVVRDLTLPPQVEQRVWTLLEDQGVVRRSQAEAEAEYERCHRLMMRAIRVRQVAMTRTHYLWGVTSGAFSKPEGA